MWQAESRGNLRPDVSYTFTSNPPEENPFELAIILTDQREKVTDNLHVAVTERARRSMTDHVPSDSVVKHRIGAAVGLECTIGTPGQRLHNRGLCNRYQFIATEYRSIVVAMHIAQTEVVIAHFGQHPRFIGAYTSPS